MVEARQNSLHRQHVPLDLRCPRRELLAYRQRRSVLHVRAAHLNHVPKLCDLLVQLAKQCLQGGQKLLAERQHDGDVHGRAERVVGALASIHVVVRVDHLLPTCALPSLLLCENAIGNAGENLVHVHVGLRAAAGLEDHEGELRLQQVLARQNLLRRASDRRRNFRAQCASIGLGSGLLQQQQRPDHALRNAVLADLEVLQRALCLRSPQGMLGNQDRAMGVVLDPHTVGDLGLTGGQDRQNVERRRQKGHGPCHDSQFQIAGLRRSFASPTRRALLG
mmetsp:Transcript_122526/g.357787  ORF Transcript_122526/g.357787 Transcript_122526/m.357787 type:complete len:278 (-) Transcript_122526:47-880(-)